MRHQEENQDARYNKVDFIWMFQFNQESGEKEGLRSKGQEGQRTRGTKEPCNLSHS